MTSSADTLSPRPRFFACCWSASHQRLVACFYIFILSSSPSEVLGKNQIHSFLSNIGNTIMTHPLIKTIMTMNSFHSGVKAMKEIFYSRQHFPTILGTSMFCSCIGGYMLMDNLHQKRLHVSEIIVAMFMFYFYIIIIILISKESIYSSTIQNQRLAYEQAWDKYNREDELRTEKYDTVIQPTPIQRRRITKSSSYAILGTSKENGLNPMILSSE